MRKRMNPFSHEHKEKFVNTFIDNLQYGLIDIDHSKMNDEDQETFDKLKLAIISVVNQDLDDNEGRRKIGSIYNYVLNLRMALVIKGELLDKTNEQIIQELKQELEVLKERNQKLYSDNVLLANQLHDSTNIIEGYEQPFVPNKDDDK
jgi:hypothetical protein